MQYTPIYSLLSQFSSARVWMCPGHSGLHSACGSLCLEQTDSPPFIRHQPTCRSSSLGETSWEFQYPCWHVSWCQYHHNDGQTNILLRVHGCDFPTRVEDTLSQKQFVPLALTDFPTSLSLISLSHRHRLFIKDVSVWPGHLTVIYQLYLINCGFF